MNNPLGTLGTILVCSITVPVMLSVLTYKPLDNKNNETEHTTNKVSQIINYEKINKEAPKITVYDHKKKQNKQISIEDYLVGVVAGEMPADFDKEALKAQAVAARTYTMYKKENGKEEGHKGAIVCTDSTHCQEYKSYEELEKIKGKEWLNNEYIKIQEAINETKGQIITFESKPILPLYFSTSSGKTENSEEVFSTKYPYLKSVDSPYDKYSPKYNSELRIENSEFINMMNKAYKDLSINKNNIRNEVKVIKRSEGGSVEKIKVGNLDLRGRDIRSVLNLNSSNFKIEIEDNYIKFIVKGFGHGVGMSQWGAEGMAQEGYMYYDILKHYYSETEIKDIY